MSDVLGMWHGEHKPTTREHVRCSVTRALPVAWVLCTYVHYLWLEDVLWLEGCGHKCTTCGLVHYL